MTLQTDDPADAEETPAADELPAPMTIEEIGRAHV